MSKTIERNSNEERAKKRPHIFGKITSDEGLSSDLADKNYIKKEYMENGGEGLNPVSFVHTQNGKIVIRSKPFYLPDEGLPQHLTKVVSDTFSTRELLDMWHELNREVDRLKAEVEGDPVAGQNARRGFADPASAEQEGDE